MAAFSHSIVCILALLTGDVRFQANGYNLSVYELPSIVGSGGLLLGFVGLLGVYDDKPLLLKVFNYWLAIKIVVMLAVAIADYWTLRKCDSWLNLPEHLTANNVQLDALAEQHVCPWARWAYAIGVAIDVSVWSYFAVRSFEYQWQLELNPPYAIDFGRENYDKEARWRLYQVKDPTRDLKERATANLNQSDVPDYGSLSEQQQLPGETEQEDHEDFYTYAPTGERVLRRPDVGDPEDGTRAVGGQALRDPSEMINL
eukprot:CAMPEP_0179055536 /NCGR_PEP_ID=MMETSP0796-20121207/23352_1 /TAXON_ID=73915 /ORGANISM="Pyrodinium bahamense, Strain pbaha01" /LENGTH=256 /DNA_ID=CAMNT_0020752193 /DNA_START=211 /DNA_END=981 /DNA_ORIENTATION=+